MYIYHLIRMHGHILCLYFIHVKITPGYRFVLLSFLVSRLCVYVCMRNKSQSAGVSLFGFVFIQLMVRWGQSTLVRSLRRVDPTVSLGPGTYTDQA